MIPFISFLWLNRLSRIDVAQQVVAISKGYEARNQIRQSCCHIEAQVFNRRPCLSERNLHSKQYSKINYECRISPSDTYYKLASASRSNHAGELCNDRGSCERCGRRRSFAGRNLQKAQETYASMQATAMRVQIVATMDGTTNTTAFTIRRPGRIFTQVDGSKSTNILQHRRCQCSQAVWLSGAYHFLVTGTWTAERNEPGCCPRGGGRLFRWRGGNGSHGIFQ